MKRHALLVSVFACVQASGPACNSSGQTSSVGADVTQSELAAAEVGTLPGSLTVLPTGDASYEVPIAVPPGRGGVTPSLSFTYSSARGNDWLGVGWTLSGLSAIEECPRTYRDSGDLSPDAPDYCLDGNRLVEVAPSDATNPDGKTEYRTIPDRFARITGGGSTWTVETRDGLVHEYAAMGSGAALQSTADRYGNRIDYSAYVFADGRVRLHTVEYNVVGGKPLARVELHYEDRPDPFLGMVGGTQVRMDQRLRRVDVLWEGDIVRFYDLAYDDDLGVTSSTGRSRLSSIQMCYGARDPQAPWQEITTVTCMPPTRFSYQDSEPGFEDGVDVDLPQPAPEYEHAVVAADITGDGSDDMVLAGLVGADWVWLYARANRFVASGFDPWKTTNIPVGDARFIQTLDLNNDRYTDLVYLKTSDSFEVLAGDPGQGLSSAAVVQAPDNYTIEFLAAVDINGDGFRDIVTCERPMGEFRRWVWYKASGSIDLDRRETAIACGGGTKLAIDHDFNGAASLVDLGSTIRCQVVHPYDEPLPPQDPTPACPLDEDAILAQCMDAFGCDDEPCDVHAATTYQSTTVGDLSDCLDPYKAESCYAAYSSCAVTVSGGTGNILGTHQLDGPLSADWYERFESLASADSSELQSHVLTPLGTPDITGDGVPDPLFVRNEWDGPPIGDPHERSLVAFIGTGAPDGFVTSTSTTSPLLDDEDNLQYVRFLDWDADGTTELVFPHDGTWKVLSYALEDVSTNSEGELSEGSLGELLIDTGIPFSGAAVVGDFDGDGLDDMLQNSGLGSGFPTNRWTLYRHTHPRYRQVEARGLPDLLREIENGYGERLHVDYTPLTDVVTYAENCAYPQRCNARPRSVVVEHAVHEMPPAHYTYARPRTDALGRAWLGFERVTVSRDRGPNGPIITWLDFDNTTFDPDFDRYAVAGKLVREATWVNGGPTTEAARFYDVTHEPAVEKTAGGASYYVYAHVTREQIYELGVSDVVDPDGAMNGPIIDRERTTTRDEYGNVKFFVHSFDDDHHLTATMTYDNDETLWLITRTDIKGVSSLTPNGNATRWFDYDWNDKGRLERLIRAPNENEYRRTQRFEYDGVGNLETAFVTSNLGETHSTSYVWDPVAQVFPYEVTNAVGHTERTEWDPAWGVVTRTADAMGSGWSYEYDAFGRPVSALFHDEAGVPSGQQLTIGYERRDGGNGQVASRLRVRRQAAGGSHQWTNYDRHGRPVRNAWHVATEASYRDLRYDELGRVVEVTQPTWLSEAPEVSTELVYDNHDRLRFTYLADSGLIERSYDGLATVVTDAEGRATRHELDARGNLARVFDGWGSNDETRACYEYGPFDDAIRYIRGCGAAAQATTTYVAFDPYGRRMSIDDPALGTWKFRYDGFDNVRQTTDGNGKTVDYDFDAIGRLIQRTEADSGAVQSWDWDDTYLGALHRRSVLGGASEVYGYDDLGRLRDVTTQVGGEEFVHSLEYDSAGRVFRTTYPGDAELPPFRVQVAYSNWGEVIGIADADAGTIFYEREYVDAAGRPTRTAAGNGLETAYTYDPLGRVTSIKTAHPGDIESLLGGPDGVFWETYDWDLSGNMWRRTDHVHGQRDEIQYDALSRLRHVETVDLSTMNAIDAWATYDDYGSFDTRTGAGIYDVTPGGRVLSTNDRGYSYDGNGNVTSVYSLAELDDLSDLGGGGSAGTLPIDIEWNGLDMPSSITTPEGVVDLEYDANGNLVKRSEPSRTVIYVGSYERVAEAVGPYQHRYKILGPNGAVAQVTRTRTIASSFEARGSESEKETTPTFEDEILWIHNDHVGSPRAYTDDTGAAVQRLSFDAWGASRSPDDWVGGDIVDTETSVELGFGGHRDAGPFVDTGGRYFDPHTAVFLRPDPFVQDPSSTQGLNRYAYTLQNPLSFVDPSGFLSVTKEWAPQTNTGGVIGAAFAAGWALGDLFKNIDWAEAGRLINRFFTKRVAGWFKNIDLGRGGDNKIRATSTVAVSPEMSMSGAGNAFLGFVDAATDWAGSLVVRGLKHNPASPWGLYFIGSDLLDMGSAFAGAVMNKGAGHATADAVANGLGLLDVFEGLDDIGRNDHYNGVYKITTGATKMAEAVMGRMFLKTPKCFPAGTKVHAADGTVAIEELEVGDLVWTQDAETREQVLRPVTRVFVTPDMPLVELVFEAGGGEIERLKVTSGHPFWVRDHGWIDSHLLRPGDRVFSLQSGWLRLTSGTAVQERATVYNVSVAEHHTYFVGDAGVWAHNAPVCFRGGSYGKLRGGGGEVHHMPAASALEEAGVLSHYRGPSIRMLADDHHLTASWGRSKQAIAYRNQQIDLIKQGKFREALEMDIADIRAKFGSKYDTAIEEMLEYVNELEAQGAL